MSEVTINGEQQAHPTGTTIADVVRSLTDASTGCAVAVNDAVVPRSDWPSRLLEAGDRVEVLTAVQGG